MPTDVKKDGPGYFWARLHALNPLDHIQRRLLALLVFFTGVLGSGLTLIDWPDNWAISPALAIISLVASAVFFTIPFGLPPTLPTRLLARVFGAGITLILVGNAFVPGYQSEVLEVLMAPALLVIALTLPWREASLAGIAFALTILIQTGLPVWEHFRFGEALIWAKLAGLLFVFLCGGLMARHFESLSLDNQVTQDRFKLIFEHAPAAIAIFDNDLRYIAHTRRWATDYGFDGEDFTGRQHYEVFPEIGEKWKDDHRRNLAGETLHNPEDAFPRADGSVDYVNWTNVPWHTPDGKIGGVIMATQVVTQQVQQRQTLEQLNQDLEDFASSAAHDLKGPLRRISAFGDMIERRYADALPEEARPLLQQMTSNAKQSQLLVSHLLDFARLRDADITLSALSTDNMLERLKLECADQISESGLTLTVEGQARLLGEAEMVQQVLRNLLSNSIRYGKNDRLAVHIQISEQPGRVTLVWQDNGPGFPTQYERRIFKMFAQLDASSDPDSTGVGLALVERAMQRMQGRVSAAGNPGVGAAFTLCFLSAR